jgi:hypothetical protein
LRRSEQDVFVEVVVEVVQIILGLELKMAEGRPVAR